MNEYNDIRIDNDIPITNDIRYTNDDIPYNEKAVRKENDSVKEFGETTGGSGPDSSGFRFHGDMDIAKVAATFTVVAVVAMAVVLDDSAFGEFFDPITGIITEGFGIGDDDGYGGVVTMTYLVTDKEIKYHIDFSEDPGSDIRLKVTRTLVDRDIDLSAGTDGIIEKLNPGMKYNLAVYVGGEKVRSWNVTTLKTYSEAPLFKLIYGKCYCEVDDSFHFRFDVIDRNGVRSDYTAKLVYDNGQGGSSEAFCQFTGDVTGEQTISTIDIPADLRDARLVIECKKTVGGNEITETLYDETVKI